MEITLGQDIASLMGFMGNFGLYSAVVGFSVMLLMPEKTGYTLGARLATFGGIAMGYEVVLARVI